jgi:hypothetical protein
MEVIVMSRRTVSQVFLWTLIAMIAGLVLLVGALVALLTNDAFIMDGPDVVGFRSGAFGWTMVGVGVAGALLVVGGAIGQFVAWIGALVRTVEWSDKTWFVVLLVTGLLGMGLIGMIIFLIAAKEPDEALSRQPPDAAFAGVS